LRIRTHDLQIKVQGNNHWAAVADVDYEEAHNVLTQNEAKIWDIHIHGGRLWSEEDLMVGANQKKRNGVGGADEHEEPGGVLGLAGGRRGRPELKKKGDVRLVRNGELAKIEGLPDRFLGRGGRGE
jgi:hypothetical protein